MIPIGEQLLDDGGIFHALNDEVLIFGVPVHLHGLFSWYLSTYGCFMETYHMMDLRFRALPDVAVLVRKAVNHSRHDSIRLSLEVATCLWMKHTHT